MDMNGTKKLIAMMALTMMVLVPLGSMMDVSADDSTVEVLFDMGNGETYWTSSVEVTYETISSDAASNAGLSFSTVPVVEINGISSTTVEQKDYDDADYPNLKRVTGNGVGRSPFASSGADIQSSWNLYGWDNVASEWVLLPISDIGDDCTHSAIAWGFYPNSVIPTETPENKRSWTMMRGDSASTGNQGSDPAVQEAELSWSKEYAKGSDFVCATPLVAGDKVFIVAGGSSTSGVSISILPRLYCYDRITGDELWVHEYDIGAGYETASPALVNGYIYLPTTNGNIYKISTEDGSVAMRLELPMSPADGTTLTGSTYQTGAASMIYDSGVLYFGSSNGTIYCCNLNLEVLWMYQTTGCIYYNSPTVDGDRLYVGAYDGKLYSLDRFTGDDVNSVEVYQKGLVNSIIVVDDTIIMPYSDGKGMNTLLGGIAAYNMDLTLKWKKDDLGLVSNYMVKVDDGVLVSSEKGIFRMDAADGNKTLLNDSFGTVKAPMTLVNGDTLYIQQYKAGGSIFTMELDGTVTGEFKGMPSSRSSYSMCTVVVIDGWIYSGNDKGSAFAIEGLLVPLKDDSGAGAMDPALMTIIVLTIIVLIAALGYYVARKKGIIKVDENMSHTKRSKRRLLWVIILGSIAAFILFIMSLSVGPSVNLSLADAFSALVSYLQKDGGYTFNEVIVGNERLPRVMAVFAVGVGLSVAGAMYQAIIRNPLVDPYIMGVSSGAGAAAIAVIAFNFTFFGLFDSSSLYATPIAAMIGGIAAFFCTMFIAEKAGKSSVNYVLAGVVVGLAFSAIQTLLLSMAGDKL
ncbi:iron chelate uptake ABC transporter family permease subunit, partial [Porphyromonadaceae bacterium OttesenSCG-928-L07]|nr:iron chelate uptake ABC transporter family permease subunit [Porphyromonadaceae bacterium OttesenSCG-928-L07]